MDFANYTPFPGESWSSFDDKGFLYQTTLIRVKYRFLLQEDGTVKFQLDTEQGDLLVEDEYWGESSQSSIRYPCDYVTYKPKTDIIINARTFAPNSEPATEWLTGVSVREGAENLLDVKVHITGPRLWHKMRLVGWILEDTEAITELPLRYEYAYGGTRYGKSDEGSEPEVLCFCKANPIGAGLLYKKLAGDQAVPQILHPDSQPHMGAPYDALIPIGFGAIDNHWQGRIEHAGTYDKKWLQHSFPMPPGDFNFLYNQQAHPQLRLSHKITPQSVFTLQNMLPDHPLCSFRVPVCKLYRFLPQQKQRTQIPIDTVLIDIDSNNPADRALYISYRLYEKCPYQSQPLQVVLEQEVVNG